MNRRWMRLAIVSGAVMVALAACGIGEGSGNDAGTMKVDAGQPDAGPADAGTPRCGATTCQGCCSATGSCIARPNNTNTTTCGTSGSACVDCTGSAKVCDANTAICVSPQPPSACDGCLLGAGACVTLANTSVLNCGSGGQMCVQCAQGQGCTGGACR